MEDTKLIFSLDHHDEGPTVAFSKEKLHARDGRPDHTMMMDLDLNRSYGPQTHFLPHSPSSPGSLSDLSATESLLISTNLVKSSSTDLEPKKSSSLKGKPLLSLVKSLSTEISRRGEPEVNLSKSDSKLHLHPWKQLTQSKIPEAGVLTKNKEWASTSSAGSLSPTEPRGSSLIADWEDTRRKFSEAMQDQFSMLSKIMREESCGSPKLGRVPGTGDAQASFGGLGRDGSSEDGEIRCQCRTDGEHRALCDTPLRRRHGSLCHTDNWDDLFENDSYEDVIKNKPRGTNHNTYTQTPGSDTALSPPFYWLIPVGVLAYGFFVLPLPSYLTGLSIGVACGYILGLVLVFLFAQKSSGGPKKKNCHLKSSPEDLDENITHPRILMGWMNETDSYDPETFHPSITHSVHVSLDGSQLQVAYPRVNIPRWSAFDESSPEAHISHARTYQLANSKVTLIPPGLARKRVWNKKYPISITLAGGEVVEETLVEGQREEEEERSERQRGQLVVDDQLPVTLYLFGRTGRDKEEWFQHFVSASRAGAKTSVSAEENTGHCEAPSGGESVRESVEELLDPPGGVKTRTLLDYSTYMTQLIGSDSCNPTPSPCQSDQESPTSHKKIHSEELTPDLEAAPESSVGSGAGGCPTEEQPSWINALVGRIFWDFLREKYWTNQVAHKIQKKLSKIKLPYFMNELTLNDLDMGNCLPQVLSISKPKLDHRGLWLEMEVVYTGCFQMTLGTKMNLCKLGQEGEDEAHIIPDTQPVGSKPRLCILADSDEESSSAASSDEDEALSFEPQGLVAEKSNAVAPDGPTGGSTGRKILRFVGKIAKSKYFKKATENKYIQKKMAEVSNLPLMLSVEVLELSGTLTINIPPPPTDRIWYSFKVPPTLDLHVRPMLGVMEVTFTHVTEWIGKKLQCEFQKVLVMPNMDDIYLPLMTSGLENSPGSHHSSVHSASQQSSMESQDYLSE